MVAKEHRVGVRFCEGGLRVCRSGPVIFFLFFPSSRNSGYGWKPVTAGTAPPESFIPRPQRHPSETKAMKDQQSDSKKTIAGKTAKAGKASKTVKTTSTAKTAKGTKTVKAAKTAKATGTGSTSKTSRAKNTSGAAEETEKGYSDLYENLSAILKDHLQRAGTLTEEVFERALKEAMEYAEEKRTNYKEDIARVSEFVKRDWHAAIRFARDQAKRSLNLDRWQAGILGVLSTLAKSAGEQLESFANKINDKLTYQAGEVAGAGMLACTECGETISFEKTAKIPPCPKCDNGVFRRAF